MSFDVAAEAYDSFMGRYSRPLAGLFAASAGLPAHGRALDVGCGPGALIEELARRFGETEVAGVDPSESFVAAAAARHPWADIRHGFAEQLPFDDDSFDTALAALVVHFMTDAAAGTREMVRVTRPGGVVAACVWDFAGGRAPQSLFFAALGSVVSGIDDETHRIGASAGDLPQTAARRGMHGGRRDRAHRRDRLPELRGVVDAVHLRRLPRRKAARSAVRAGTGCRPRTLRGARARRAIHRHRDRVERTRRGQLARSRFFSVSTS